MVTLAPLAQISDLPTTLQGSPFAQRGLDVATAFVREAAGVPITEVTTTIGFTGGHEPLLRLPQPFSAVTSVTIDGEAQILGSTYAVVDDGLWRNGGWMGYSGFPADVAVSLTYGLPVCPIDLNDMVVQRAINYVKHMEAGGGSQEGIANVQVDDGREEYTSDFANRAHPCYISEVTRTWLRNRFGGGAGVVMSTSADNF